MKIFSYRIFHHAARIVIVSSTVLAYPQSIPLGKGSIASAPPPHQKIEELYAKQPLLGPKALNRPLPTNDWWTTLLDGNPFPGNLWVMPWRLIPDDQGLLLDLPKGWSEGGNNLINGLPLRLSGVPMNPGMTEGNFIISDFEEAAWPKNWKVTGDAFGKAPMPVSRHGATNISGNAYACSFWEGDSGTGTLTSPEFLITKDYLHLKVSGGDDADMLGVELLISDKVVYKALGNKSNNLLPHRWDLSAYKDRRAQIRLVDQSQGGWGFIAADAIIMSDQPEPSGSGVFQRCSVINWGDWSVNMGLHAAGAARFEITMVRGMPFVWVECKAIQPLIILENTDKLFNPQGQPVVFPFQGAQVIIQRADRLFSVYAPNNVGFEKRGNQLLLLAHEPIPYMIIGALPELNLAPAFASFAYTIPRDTRYDWTYDPVAGEVTTRWKVTSEALQGNNHEILQGWLPHHWRNTQNDLNLVPVTYDTQRGLMRMARGNAFEIRYPFNGCPIALPLITEALDATGEFRMVMNGMLSEWISDQQRKSATDRAGADTYWGGKNILALARSATLADQMNHPLREEALNQFKEALQDWFTYNPGEPARYFAKYPEPWNGVVGFNPSYGSETFTDCHFHHGYFTLAAALLARLDPQWGKDFSEITTLIARQYANWDRASVDFPFLRTFSPWVGHSYAGGMSNAQDGNNQESTSESMMGWAGLFLLGTALENDAMRDCGAMGLAVEGEAVKEYWNDYYGWKDPTATAVFPPSYQAKNSIVGVRRDRDMGYWTWFSGEAIHIYGIQWLPSWTHLLYLNHDPEFVRFQPQQMMARQQPNGVTDFESLGNDWGQVALGHLMWGDPATVVTTLNHSRSLGKDLGKGRDGGVTWAMANSLLVYGSQAQGLHSRDIFRTLEPIESCARPLIFL